MIAERTFAAIDFESAGAERGKTDVPVQIGMAMWSCSSGHINSYVSYIHTEQAVSWAAQKVHGITNNELQHAPSFVTLWPEVKNRLAGNLVVAHGHGTEKRYLRSFPAHGFGPWVDTLQLYRAAYPLLSSHALGDLCDQFQLTESVATIVPGKNWHDAQFDAVASLVLLEHFINAFDLSQQHENILTQPDTRVWHQTRR